MASQTIVCPRDKGLLVESEKDGSFVCAACGKHYARLAGVVRLSEITHEFYEGAYENQVHYVPKGERVWQAWPLWLINGGYLWVTRRHIAPGSTVVELGCGGGVAYFGSRYKMIGCDLSLSSLQKAASIYQTCVQIDISAGIPIPSGSIDAVVSTCFWEHLPPVQKGAVLREVRRVLRPGGKFVFLYDVHTQNPLIAAMRRLSGERYRRSFLEKDGHFGYETADDNRKRFLAEGFRVLLHRGIEMTPILSPSVFQKFSEWGRQTDPLFQFLARLGRAPWLYPYIALQRSMDTLFGPLLPINWGRMVITVCEKTPVSQEAVVDHTLSNPGLPAAS